MVNNVLSNQIKTDPALFELLWRWELLWMVVKKTKLMRYILANCVIFSTAGALIVATV